MNIYPRRHKVFTVDGKNCFPIVNFTGIITSTFVFILFKGKPEALNRGVFDPPDKLNSDGGGYWIMVTFTHYDTESDIARKVADAEELLDGAEPKL
jgi:hypothetical protein